MIISMGCGGNGSLPNQNTLIVQVPEPAGANCKYGGTRINIGFDTDGDGKLYKAEIRRYAFVCDGVPGAGGTPGAKGDPGDPGSNGGLALVQVGPEPPGTNCAGGGQRIRAGTDSNGNGTLDAGEPGTTTYVCGAGITLFRLSAEPAGANCSAGGTKIESGVDVNFNAQLDPPEVASTGFVCTGATGTAGVNAQQFLVAVAPLAPGAQCTQGGLTITFGMDANGNLTLDPAEVTGTREVCLGTPGTPGSPGQQSLVSVTPEPDGPNCQGGGYRVQQGVDANTNNVLEAGEVAATAYVCNGPPPPL